VQPVAGVPLVHHAASTPLRPHVHAEAPVVEAPPVQLEKVDKQLSQINLHVRRPPAYGQGGGSARPLSPELAVSRVPRGVVSEGVREERATA
jgi:hypothetical protein